MKIFDYEEVKMNWDSFTYPIAVGTPVSIDGVLADNASAHGLIARTVFAKPDADETLKVMTGGIIDMEEIVAGYGQELSSAAVNALCGIHFYKDGVCIPSGGSGGGGVTPEIMAQIENAQWKTESSEELFSETVTTQPGESAPFAMGTLAYTGHITADPLIVTFNRVEYVCPRSMGLPGVYEYGAPTNAETGEMDFTECPFRIVSTEAATFFDTETPGTYTVSATAETVTTTETFDNDVNKLIANKLSGVVVETTDPNEALFCTVQINNVGNLHCATVGISDTGAVSFRNEEVLPINFKKSFVLAKGYNETAGKTIFTNGSTYLEIPSGLSSGKLKLEGILSVASGTDNVVFTTSITGDNVIAYSDLEVHYFAVKSNSEDSGGDSPIIPGPIGK